MKITENLKTEIQSFIYFLFKGTLTNELIIYKKDYLVYILNDSEFLFNCFQIFANEKNESLEKNPNEKISNYIINKIENKLDKNIESKILNEFWTDFLKLSIRFCYNEFPKEIKKFSIVDLYGNGTDSVPYFAVWTNVIEIDENYKVLNSEFALNRANERLLMWENKKNIIEFESWEIEQVLY
jgi:hypothetical protein